MDTTSKTVIMKEAPSQLIDSSLFVINFLERKFLSIGLDPVDDFNVSVRIITPSSYIAIIAETLQKIFTMVGNILSTLLNVDLKTKYSDCLVDDAIKLSKVTRQGEIKLMFRSTLNCGKALLTREDLIALQSMERSILKNILLKTNVIRPMVMRQLEQIIVYLKSNFFHCDTIESMKYVIRNVSDDSLTSLIPNGKTCFGSQLKLYADRQIAEKWMSELRTIKTSTTSLSPCPVNFTEEDTRNIIDENDGSLYFNKYLPPSSPPSPPSSPTYATHPFANIDGGNWWEH